MVAVAQQRHQSAGDGTHAGGENQRGLAALKAGDDLAQRGAVGIAGADIGIALGSVGLLNLFETAAVVMKQGMVSGVMSMPRTCSPL